MTLSVTNVSLPTPSPAWFIPLDIFMITSTVLGITLAIGFLLLILFDPTCRTVPMMLVANSCLAELVFGGDMFGMALFAFQNDLKSVYSYDWWCLFRGYMSYMSTGIQNYSYLIQATYRYLLIMHPAQLFYQSFKVQLFLICASWVCGIIYPIPILFTDQIAYHDDSQICQMPLRLSFLTIFNVTYLYFIPIGAIALIYVKMVVYVHAMSQRVTPVNTLTRAQRELTMVRRITMLVGILVALGFPYTVFIFMSFFNQAPKYHFRIAYIFVDVSFALIMVAVYQTTDPLKAAVKRRIFGRPTTILPAAT